LALTEGAVRGVNAVANVSVLATATVGNTLGADTSYADGAAKELMGTEEATRNAVKFVRDDGLFKSYDKAVERTTDAFSGDNAAWSDVTSNLTQIVAPTEAVGASLEEVGNATRQFAQNTAGRARELTQDVASGAKNFGERMKNSLRSTRVTEGAEGQPSAVPLDPHGVDPNARGLPSNEGHSSAGQVQPGGTGTAVSGHGAKFKDALNVIVPEGTAVTLPRPDIRILDITGQYIERGDWEGLAELAGTDSRLGRRVARDLEGMTTWLPGSEVPGYTLFPPDARVNLFENSRSVVRPTPLGDILEPHMGCVQWAVCTEFLNFDKPVH
jgi:hypothetical protein